MPNKPLHGFTLIEILIVIVIISIVASFAVITIGHNQHKRVEYLATQIANALTLAEQQAMLQPAVLGFSLSTHAYQFYRFQEETKQWQPLTDTILGKHLIPHDMQVKINIQTESSKENEQQPQVIIAPSGDLTPFTLLIGQSDDVPLYKVTGQSDGSITHEFYSNP